MRHQVHHPIIQLLTLVLSAGLTGALLGENLAPNSIQGSKNYVGGVSLSEINESPDLNDGEWPTWDGNGNTSVTVGFPTPASAPSGTQTFRARVRKTVNSGSMTSYNFQLLENGRVVRTFTAKDTNTPDPGRIEMRSWGRSRASGLGWFRGRNPRLPVTGSDR